MQERHPQSGFTLIEVLVVVVVLGIVSSIATIAMMDALDRARQRATMSDMRTISKAIETYAIDHSFLPASTGGLSGLVGELVPYSTSVLPTLDHWGNAYKFESTAFNYSIESFGKDGIDGTDITFSTKFEFEQDLVIVNGQFSASVVE